MAESLTGAEFAERSLQYVRQAFSPERLEELRRSALEPPRLLLALPKARKLERARGS